MFFEMGVEKNAIWYDIIYREIGTSRMKSQYVRLME